MWNKIPLDRFLHAVNNKEQLKSRQQEIKYQLKKLENKKKELTQESYDITVDLSYVDSYSIGELQFVNGHPVQVNDGGSIVTILSPCNFRCALICKNSTQYLDRPSCDYYILYIQEYNWGNDSPTVTTDVTRWPSPHGLHCGDKWDSKQAAIYAGITWVYNSTLPKHNGVGADIS